MMAFSIYSQIFLLVVLLCFVLCSGKPDKTVPKRCFRHESLDDSGGIDDSDEDCAIGQGEGPTILASLLDGSLVALNKKTGSTKWKLMDEPVVKSPYNPSKPVLPAFLPDPKDGALYVMGASIEDPLKKLPFTIPELVAASPSRTNDGILYSGKKIDTWFSVNRLTGVKQGSLSTEGCLAGVEDMCPTIGPGTILIGRTEYNIMMYDTRTKNRKWNITYYDYSSNLGGIDISGDYDLAHFTDSSTGALITLDKISGSVQWEHQFTSPVVAMYQLASDSIASIPFTSVSVETLDNLMKQFQSSDYKNKVGETKLFPTLYVGEHAHGLFAVPSLVDEQTMMISPADREGQLLLEGPRNVKLPDKLDIGVKGKAGSINKQGSNGLPFSKEPFPKDKSSILLFGYYQVPEYSSSGNLPAIAPFQLSTSQTMFPFQVNEVQMIEGPQEPVVVNNRIEDRLSQGLVQLRLINTTFIFSAEFIGFLHHAVLPMGKEAVTRVENKEMKLMVLVVLLTVLWFVRFVKIQFKKWDRGFNSNHGSNSMSHSSSVSSFTNYQVSATPVELEDGSIKVGNISFNPGQVLGKGCEGTFVYKGRFDSREVAVKRVLAACFSIADREVELLRESDEHPNVVRYFCMEQCKQFRYIALELCLATLQDCVEGVKPEVQELVALLDMTKLFRQAVQGLEHLHKLDIAHRDIKPQNVLISVPGKGGEVKAMISDFGLCKKLKVGRMSFSRRSGVAGTEGWIAPEMLLGHRSTTCQVDLFSMGCVYFYMLTKGRHPFGENFHRQANILSSRFNLDLLNQQILHQSLIQKMLSPEPTDRPPAAALLKHPVFWGKEKVLNFLQEVSDRVDKDEDGSAVLASLERFGDQVTKGDWYQLLDKEVREDLRKHRSYRGRSVRDLLRAIRNKKHHYRELTEEAKILYGRMPGEFTDYWCRRFPRLVIHTYTSMQCVKYENNFIKYYHKDYDFVPSRVRGSVCEDLDEDSNQSVSNLFSPDYLNRPAAGQSSNQSLVSTWSQLDSQKEEQMDLISCDKTESDPVDVGENNCDTKDDIHTNNEEETIKDVTNQFCDKENLKPEKTDETDIKKNKNKKRRKHQKKKKVAPDIDEVVNTDDNIDKDNVKLIQ